VLKRWRNRFFGDINMFLLNSRGIEENTEFWECLLPFDPEPSVFSSAVEKLYKTIVLLIVVYGC
jgi:hypothetical protein